MSDLKPLIAKAADGKPLTREEARTAFGIMMSGDATPSQIAATANVSKPVMRCSSFPVLA